MEKDKIITRAYEVFSACEKPKHCVDGDDPESAEFNDLPRSISRRDLDMEQVGTPAWSPLPSLNPEALAYFMPRLIELALNGAVDRDGQPFLLFFINSFHQGMENERFALFGREQRMVMADTFDYLLQNHAERLKLEGWYDEALQGARNWRDAI